MALYKVNFKSSVHKDFKSISTTERGKILKRIEALAKDPRPPGNEKLSNQNKYRIRQGDYRIIYTVDDAELMIRVMKIGHRKDIYRTREQKAKYLTKRT